ncbi:pyridoxamine 5'-phosphate oxidase family protein [Haloarcula sp. Atlit-7R]|uniref:pyridoxamine 5'-phosphate oxidase family protein n=1 Tax=Haloarcula sp. Atlit-7R TaxID=2282125 RepID=UPI000EF14A31|nr:pyridoxamine 5'-phosphate oxidase family protein [Haloarcula sp. Atlit-7R]RLM96428.1 pyridoxamine 5'-phosphate oxidase family protein [Haloarcula sp. Atlit-7R]
MDTDIAFAYTKGMPDDAVCDRLTAGESGVLALADGDDAYAFPVFHHYEGGSLYFRLGETSESEKSAYLDATETATYVVTETAATPDAESWTGWSVVARGPITAVPEDDPAYEAVEINERYAPIRVFDEPTDEMDVTLYELSVEELTGRRN